MEDEFVEIKKWYQSKTLLANLAAVLGLPVASLAGVVDKETAIVAVVGAVVNLVLRFKTSNPVSIS